MLDAYAAPFDESTRTDINQWISDHTDQRIPEMLKEFRSDAALYLVNALCFDGKWVEPYSEDAIWDGVFYAADGSGAERAHDELGGSALSEGRQRHRLPQSPTRAGAILLQRSCRTVRWTTMCRSLTATPCAR